jgi:glycosyltransferase involved in cell wall biosynthesis
MSLYDSNVFNKIRAGVICKIPNYKTSIDFISKVYDFPEKQLKEEYSHLDETIKSNPLVINFIQEKFSAKTKTSGKDIVYYCGPGSHLNFSNPWNPETSLGGSEEAVVNISSVFAKRGWNVTVFCVLKGPPKKFNGVMYRPYYEWIPKDAQDITIIWRDPSNCNRFIGSQKIFLDVHDVIEPSWLKDINVRIGVMLKSRYHRSIIGNNLKNSFHVIPNGIHPLDHSFPKTNNLIVCTSSPDRCIVGLLKATPMIRKIFPDAEIQWAYGFSSGVSEGGMETNELSKDWVVKIKERIKRTKGFKDLGKLSQDDIRKLYERADMFIYPTVFPEIDCISLTKAMSAGCITVVPPSGAMAEKMGYSTQIAKLTNDTLDYSLSEGDEFNKYIDHIIVNLQQKRVNRQVLANDTNKKYNWEHIADQWIKLF